MGLIRSSLLVVVSVLLFVSLLVSGVFLTMVNSLEYDNVKEELVPVVREIEGDNLTEAIEDEYIGWAYFCENNSEIKIGEGDMEFVISCEIVSQGVDAVLNKMIEDKVDEIYYKKYDCNFFDCNSEEGVPLFVVSEHSKNYFSSKFYLFLVISLVLFGLIFLLVEARSNAFILAGLLMLVSSLPFYKLKWVIGIFADIQLLKFFTFMFSEAFSVFVKFLILGFLLLAVGIIWKFFNIGFTIKGFFDKFRKPKFVEGVVKEKKGGVVIE